MHKGTITDGGTAISQSGEQPPLPGHSRRASALYLGETSTVGQWKQYSGSSYKQRRLMPRALGLLTACKKIKFWDCAGFTKGCFGKQPEVGKEKDQGGLRRNMHEEN